MCGFIGCFSSTNKSVVDNQTLINMRDAMTHRGPDDAGLWRAPDHRCALGHRRLSIIDLSHAAQQPMANTDNSVIIVFNGEIYNHKQLRQELMQLGKYQWKTDHSDTEVILHAFEEWHVDMLPKLVGMFSIAIYDRRNPDKPELHLIRDRIGIKPLYFSRTNTGEWVFGSEIRSLLAHPDVIREMDHTAFWHYLTFIVTPAPMTLFRGIWKLPAGFGITINHQGNAHAWQWWDCKPSRELTYSPNDLSPADAEAELLRLLRQAISRRMVADVPFGVLLSGGVDSSLNVALMSELMDRPVTTFSIGYATHEEFNEFEYARRIAKRYRTDHYETQINGQEALDFLPLLVQLQDEPIADNVCIPLYFLAKLVKSKGTTVVQVGEGADENFLGYWWCDHYRKKYQDVYLPAQQQSSWWQRLLFKSKHRLPGLAIEDKAIIQRARQQQQLFWGGAVCWWGDMRSQLTPDLAPFGQSLECPVANLLPASHSKLDSHAIVNHYLGSLNGQLVEPEILQKIPYMEHKLRLPEHLLMRVDKMTMAHSIEARVPFLDHDIVEFAMRLPAEYKLHNGIGKAILKKIAEPFVDDDMLYRRKQGFGAPMEKWFKEPDFGQRCLDAFNKSDLVKAGFINKDYFTKLLSQQMRSGGGYSFHLWTVMNAILWHEVWINRNLDCL